MIHFQNVLKRYQQYFYYLLSFTMQETKIPVIYADSLPCCNDHHSLFICTNENCHESAFICNDQTCDCIQKKHYKCNSNVAKYLIQSIEKQKKDLETDNQAAFQGVINIYDDMIETLSKDREEFIKFTELFGLTENMRYFVTLINQGRAKQIDGNLAFKVKNQVFSRLQHTPTAFETQKDILKKWEIQRKKFDATCAEIRKYQGSGEKYKKKINSKITDIEGQKRIEKFLGKKVRKYELLYRGSQKQFSQKAFHDKCDGISDTLTIIQSEFGNILGGYTPLKWKAPQSQEYSQDLSGRSFIYSLTLNKKFELKQRQRAICNNNNFGPVFGGHNGCHDLAIKGNVGNYVCFPGSYVDRNQHALDKNQQTWTALSGQAKGKNFRIKQYEVFKVYFEEQ